MVLGGVSVVLYVGHPPGLASEPWRRGRIKTRRETGEYIASDLNETRTYIGA